MRGKWFWLALASTAILLSAGCIEGGGENVKDPEGDEEDPLVEENKKEEKEEQTDVFDGLTKEDFGDAMMQAFLADLSPGGDAYMIQGSFSDPENPAMTAQMPADADFWVRFGGDGGSRQQVDMSPYFQLTIYCFSNGMIYELTGDYDPADLDGMPGPGAYEARSPDEKCDTTESFGDGFWRDGFMIKDHRFAQTEAVAMTFNANSTDPETGQLVLEYDEVDWRDEKVGDLTVWIDLDEPRLTALRAEYENGVQVAFDVEHGDRVSFGRPALDVTRLPAEVDGYEDHDHNYHYHITAPEGAGVPLDQFEVRFYDPASPQDYVAFDPTGPADQQQEDWYFTYFDEDGDGTMNAGDRFQVMPEWNYNYGGDAYPYEEYYDHTAVVWDLWADAPVSADVPGPGIVAILLLTLLGGVVLRRKRDPQ